MVYELLQDGVTSIYIFQCPRKLWCKRILSAGLEDQENLRTTGILRCDAMGECKAE